MTRVVIFGASKGGINGLDHLNKTSSHFEMVAFIDNDRSKWGTSLKGLPIIGPGDIDRQIDFIFVASSYYEEIWAQLLELGFSPQVIKKLPAKVLMGSPPEQTGLRPLLLTSAFTLLMLGLMLWFAYWILSQKVFGRNKAEVT